MAALEVDRLTLTEILEIWVIELRATLALALGTHRHAAAIVAKASKACLRRCVFNLVAERGGNTLTVIPEVVLMWLKLVPNQNNRCSRGGHRGIIPAATVILLQTLDRFGFIFLN